MLEDGKTIEETRQWWYKGQDRSHLPGGQGLGMEGLLAGLGVQWLARGGNTGRRRGCFRVRVKEGFLFDLGAGAAHECWPSWNKGARWWCRREAGGDHRDESLDTGRALGGSSNRKQVQDRRLIGSGVGRWGDLLSGPLPLPLRNKKQVRGPTPELLEPPGLLSIPGLGPRADQQVCPPAAARWQGAGSHQEGRVHTQSTGPPRHLRVTLAPASKRKSQAWGCHLVLQKPIPEEKRSRGNTICVAKKKDTTRCWANGIFHALNDHVEDFAEALGTSHQEVQGQRQEGGRLLWKLQIQVLTRKFACTSEMINLRNLVNTSCFQLSGKKWGQSPSTGPSQQRDSIWSLRLKYRFFFFFYWFIKAKSLASKTAYFIAICCALKWTYLKIAGTVWKYGNI